MDNLVSINGQFSNTISVNDRGLLFGESVYEVIPVYNGVPYLLDHHLTRLQNGYQCFSPIKLPLAKIKIWIKHYLKQSPSHLDNLYIQVTTGSIPLRNHKPNDTITPTVIIHKTANTAIDMRAYEKGFRAICVPDQRSFLSAVKTNNISHNTQALRQALAHGYDDAVFVRNNCIVEGSSSNIFAVIDNILITPPTRGIVSGTTRNRLLQLADDQNIPYKVTQIPKQEITNASEVFLSSSLKLLRPLIEIENCFQTKSPGPIWHQLLTLLKKDIRDYCKNPNASSENAWNV